MAPLLLSTHNNMETRASGKSSGIKSTPSSPATPSNREQRLQTQSEYRVQNELNLLSQSSKNDATSTPQGDDYSTNYSLNITQSFTFPDFDCLIHNPRSLQTPRPYSERFHLAQQSLHCQK